MFKIGQKFSETKSFNQEDVDAFAKVTGDHNKLHRAGQENYLMFNGPIVHGALIMGYFSKIFATDLPGPGTIYLSQELLFKRPLYVGEEANFSVEIADIRGSKLALTATCVNKNGETVCDGTALLLNKALHKEDIVAKLAELGVCTGDMLLVHSAFNSFGPVIGGPQIVIDALSEAVGKDGTLVMPTFNFDFGKGVPYDRKNTPSKMGAIGELTRINPHATRIHHPMYSFAVLGKLAPELSLLKNVSAYGTDSLFGELYRRRGKILILGLSYNNSMTFFHHVEEMTGCNYRYMKSFTGDIIYEDGTTKKETYTMFVRDIDAGVHTMVDPAGEKLDQLGLVNKIKIGNCDAKLLKAQDVFNASQIIVKEESYLLHRIVK